MHPLLIVDDHAHIVEDIAGTIPWEAHGVGPVYKAYSGLGALKVMEEHPVDVILLDIKMPGMSGLELIERIRATWPDTKCILLSGFAEFEYAKQAILAQISDYLLKPAANDEIVEVVTRVIGELRRERESDEMVRRAIHTLRENLPRLHETLLLDVLHKRIGSEQALLNKMRTYELNFGPGDRTAMLLIRLEEEFDEYDEHSVSLFEFAVCNITEEIFRPAYELWYGKDPHDYLVFLVKPKEAAADAETFDLEALAERLQDNVRAFLKGRISILATTWGDFPNDIPPLYQQALFSFRQRVGSEREFFLKIGGEPEPAKIESIESLYEPPTFKQLFEAGRYEQIKAKLDGIFREVNDKWNESQEHILEVFFEISGSFTYICHKNGRRLHELVSAEDYEKLLDANQFQTIRQLEEWAYRVYAALKQEMDKEAGNTRASIVSQIHQYIERHMAEDVSVQTLADHVYLNPSYLSRVYKSETGESISDYLYRFRMEKAAYLLKNTHERIYEITARLGYQNPQYFIKVFKRYFGITPQEYRDKNKS